MTDKLAQDIERGHHARRLLDDELIVGAREHMEAELWRLFKETKPSDAETLKFLKAMQYFHGKYFDYLEKFVVSGKLAAINLEAKKKTLLDRVFGSA